MKAEISKTDAGVFKVVITYSYYGLYEFEKVKVCRDIAAAKDWLLRQRCGGNLYIFE